jgi:hypothetical protein
MNSVLQQSPTKGSGNAQPAKAQNHTILAVAGCVAVALISVFIVRLAIAYVTLD